MSDHDAVNHPKHYTSGPARCACGEPVECIQIAQWHSFAVGNVIKYLWRAGLKPGADALEDHRKALWYLSREVERLEQLAKCRD